MCVFAYRKVLMFSHFLETFFASASSSMFLLLLYSGDISSCVCKSQLHRVCEYVPSYIVLGNQRQYYLLPLVHPHILKINYNAFFSLYALEIIYNVFFSLYSLRNCWCKDFGLVLQLKFHHSLLWLQTFSAVVEILCCSCFMIKCY